MYKTTMSISIYSEEFGDSHYNNILEFLAYNLVRVRVKYNGLTKKRHVFRASMTTKQAWKFFEIKNQGMN